MTHRNSPSLLTERALGFIGLLLIGLLGWACDWAQASHRLTRTRAIIAWMVIESVTGIGWTVDRLFPIASRDDTTGLAAVDPKTDGGVR